MQRRLDRRDIPCMAALCLLFGIFVFIYTGTDYAYGSELDWTAQHYAIPDYFRKLFYETGEFFPSLALNIGGGENIYALSYYGLYSPVILISYLMPSVPMYLYIEVSTALLVLISCLLFYRFMRKRAGKIESLILAVMFLAATPLILHSHRHIMFVNYMPLLILALESVDSYFERGRKLGLTVCCFLIILTSWFFSVSALCAVAVYAVYKYLSVTENVTFKGILIAGAEVAGRMMVSAMMAAVLLLPTLAVILGGRDEAHIDLDILSFIPYPRLGFLGYSGYSMGVGAMALLAIVAAIIRGGKARRFLGITLAALICFPLLVFALNGTLYLDAKVLIPFMPLALILCSSVYHDLPEKRLSYIELMITGCLLAFGLIVFDGMYGTRVAFMADSIIFLVFAVVYCFKSSPRFFVVPCLVVPLVSSVIMSKSDTAPLRERVEKLNSEDYTKLCESISDDNLWRASMREDRSTTTNTVYAANFYSPNIYSSIHNKYYNNFYFEEMNNENEYRNSALTTCSANPFFNVFMANKYFITESGDVPYGCTVIDEIDGKRLLENNNVAAFGRCAPTLSEETFDSLFSGDKMTALCNYIICGDNTEFTSNITRINDIILPENSHITFKADGYKIAALKRFELDVHLDQPVPEGKVLLIETETNKMLGRPTDARLTINGIRNTLTDPTWKYYNNNTTFTYVLTPKNGEPITDLHMIFTDGRYSLAPLKAYITDYPTAPDNDQLIVDMSRTSGDVITGSINCTKDSMFMLTLPYSEGYEITVDGQKQDYELVSKAFIGFELTEGEHEITVRFTAPLLKAGKLGSAVGFAAFLALAVVEIVSIKKRKKPETEKAPAQETEDNE